MTDEYTNPDEFTTGTTITLPYSHKNQPVTIKCTYPENEYYMEASTTTTVTVKNQLNPVISDNYNGINSGWVLYENNSLVDNNPVGSCYSGNGVRYTDANNLFYWKLAPTTSNCVFNFTVTSDYIGDSTIAPVGSHANGYFGLYVPDDDNVDTPFMNVYWKFAQLILTNNEGTQDLTNMPRYLEDRSISFSFLIQDNMCTVTNITDNVSSNPIPISDNSYFVFCSSTNTTSRIYLSDLEFKEL